MIGYHATSQKTVEQLLKKGETIEPCSPQNWENDLGKGIYTFIDADGLDYLPPNQNAKLYYRSFRRGKCKVLEIEINDNASIIDFNDKNEEKKFVRLRHQVYSLVVERVRKDRKVLSSAQMRNNADGLIIEACIRAKALRDVDLVIKDTFTSFLDPTICVDDKNKLISPKGRRVTTLKMHSNFPNGRECCIRHKSAILKNSLN